MPRPKDKPRLGLGVQHLADGVVDAGQRPGLVDDPGPACCLTGPGHGKPADSVGDQDRDQFVELAVPPSAESWSIRRPAIMLVTRAPRGLHAAHAAELAYVILARD